MVNIIYKDKYQKAAEGALKGEHIDLFYDIFAQAPLKYIWELNKLAESALAGIHGCV